MPSDALLGTFRSLRTYYSDAHRAAQMDTLYGAFLDDDDLAFDIGSHVGDRIASFRRCGAKVVAVEPQPFPFRVLRLLYGRDQQVELIQAACGQREGTIEFHVNSNNPTVSTASDAFTAAAKDARGWDDQIWDRSMIVPSITLDTLISQHGRPRFIKIDVEGFEADVLAGLSQPVAALSFEFTTIQTGLVRQCLDHLSRLGAYRFDVALGETQQRLFDKPLEADALWSFIQDLPHEANSGDIYAIRDTEPDQ